MAIRILLVEDDEDARDILAEVLPIAGASVVTASSAAAVFDAFDAATFDALVSDLGMPGADGLTLLERIRAVDATRGRRLVAVAVSGYGSPEGSRIVGSRRVSRACRQTVRFTRPRRTACPSGEPTPTRLARHVRCAASRRSHAAMRSHVPVARSMRAVHAHLTAVHSFNLRAARGVGTTHSNAIAWTIVHGWGPPPRG